MKLSQAGFRVIATARDVQSLEDLHTSLKLPLDVTSPQSIAAAVDQVHHKLGQIDVLINNAGFAVRGAVDEVPVEQVMQSFDANVYGVIRMVQAVTPHMRAQNHGMIINIGSFAGKLVVPVNGVYSATKFALEAINDAMRLELQLFGIRVILIEPGNIRTNFMETSQNHSHQLLDRSGSPYYRLYQAYLRTMIHMRRHDPGPDAVSRVVERIMQARHPKARYLVAVPLVNRFAIHLNDALRDRILMRIFKD
jgi:NADP-dependent 3-hydroxy acid dehydrogenase YdfG